jgi:hypothetical protein
MNEINVKRMVLAGLAMLVMWIALEVLVEGVMAEIFLGRSSGEMWQEVIDPAGWSGLNTIVSTSLAVMNCTITIWLYASLRPMYGVGTKTVLITSAFFLIWVYSLFINLANMGLISAEIAFLEAIFETIELPIAMFVGAGVYEGKDKEGRGVVSSVD